RAAIAEAHGVHAHTVALLRPRGLPKTSSGKVQRRASREGLLAGTLPIFVCSVSDTTLAPEVELAAHGPTPNEQFAAAEDADRGKLVADYVRHQLAGLLRRQPEAIALEAAPAALGLDSLSALDLQTRFERAVGVALGDGWIWQHPTLGALADDLL